MASILVRCTGGTDIPADALAAWLERQSSRIEIPFRLRATRLASVDHVDEAGGQSAGWLVELDVADGQVAYPERALAHVLSDMRLLGLRPALFVPYATSTPESPDVDARSDATVTDSCSA